MSITPRQKELVQASFTAVEPIADKAAEIFYNKLFEYDPSLRQLFRSPLQSQGRMLMATLKTAVESLDAIEGLIPVLQALADRHVKYGVHMDDYTPVGNALLHTLETGLGSQWNPELRSAWVTVYRTIAEVMRSHAYPQYNAKTYRNAKIYDQARAATTA